jgi:hypothetical protein
VRRRKFGDSASLSVPLPKGGEIGPEYRLNVDYTQEKYLYALRETEDAIVRMVDDLDHRIERHQRMFFAGLAVLVAIPLYSLSHTRKTRKA